MFGFLFGKNRQEASEKKKAEIEKLKKARVEKEKRSLKELRDINKHLTENPDDITAMIYYAVGGYRRGK